MREVAMVELDPNDLHRTEDLMRNYGFEVLESETKQGISFVKVDDDVDEVMEFLENNGISGYVYVDFC